MKELLEKILGRLRESTQKRKLRNFEDADFLLSLSQSDEIPLPVACAVVLSDIALIDGSFDHAEYHFLFTKLEEELGVTAGETQQIVKQARDVLASGRGSLGYAEYIKKSFTAEQRERIFAMVQGMASADGVNDGFETYLTNRLRVSLGLEQ